MVDAASYPVEFPALSVTVVLKLTVDNSAQLVNSSKPFVPPEIVFATSMVWYSIATLSWMIVPAVPMVS